MVLYPYKCIIFAHNGGDGNAPSPIRSGNLLNLMSKNTRDIAYFISFCIEQYKHAKQMTGSEVVDLFTQYGVLDYLNEHFEVLHTQSRQWLLEDIDEFIRIRK